MFFDKVRKNFHNVKCISVKLTLFRIMINIKLIRAAVEAAITPTHDISMLEDVAMEAYTAILYMITDVIPTTTRIIYNIHKKTNFYLLLLLH